jgi:drug/metabolite transporter (DMT)-like permease
MRLKGQPNPRGAQWRNLAIIGLVMFAAVYGPLFWAERYVSSGTASVLEATIPLITIGMEVFLIRNLPFRWSLIGAAVLGFCGVGVLLLSNGDQPARLLPCIAVLAGASAWSLGSVLNRTMDLPASKPLTAGASMMLGGVALFALSLLFGELRSPPNITLRSAAALAYLIVFASLVSFTAFVWLLGRMPASQVASHAYVNPVVAIALGYFAGGETISWRMLAGSGLIVLSVFLILRKR